MQFHKNTRWMIVSAIIVGTICLPVFMTTLLESPPLGQVQEILLRKSHPRPAASDLAFDRYLDQVIAGQAPSGTLPALAPPTLRGTFLAVRALQQLGYGTDVNSAGIQTFVASCYDGTSRLFADDTTNALEIGVRVSGYSPIEASYYALATLALLDVLQPSAWQATGDALLALQGGTGGFACRPGLCTTHDAYFACKALQLLGDAGMVNVNALASFLDARQASDPARWWEYGAFTNLPPATGEDTDFTEPNMVTSYYAVATLAACGRLSVLNEDALVGFMSLLKNMSSNLYSYATGNERAEHVGTASLLALDQYLTSDGTINYAAAGTALIARLDAGNFNEGRKAPSNHTLSAACEMVGGLSEGGRLGEVSSTTKEKLREFISLHLVASGSMAGYALTRLASFHELANLLPAITGAGKVDTMNVNALYAFIKGYYSKVLAYFSADGTALLQRDLPSCYAPGSPDGAFASGIAVTLPALQTLKAIGRLNDFLGETHATANILGNITASQFLNASAPAVNGAFCPQASFADECEGNEGIRAYIGPQWTLQALETIAILDPVAPATHFNVSAAWQYLSRWYAEDGTGANFTKPAWINVSPVEWTCRMATALCHGGMAGYFDLVKTNAWVLSHLDISSAREVAWHLRFLESTTGISRATYAVSTLNTLKDSLVTSGEAWYYAQGEAWPDSDIVGILAQFRADRQVYLLNPVTPNPMILGGDNAVSVDVSNLFAIDLPSNAIVTFSALSKSITLTRGTPGHYCGSYQCPYNYSRLGPGDFVFTAERGGWQSAAETGGVTFAGTLVATVTCGGVQVSNGTTLAVKGSVISVETTLTVKLGAGESPAELLGVSAIVYAGGTRVTNMTLSGGTAGIYAGSYAVGTAGTYTIEIVVQGTVLAYFSVVLDGTKQDPSEDLGDLKGLSDSLIVSSAAGGVVALGIGLVVRKKPRRQC